MVVVKLTGGLGNQLFQYAAGRAIALRNNVALKLDVSAFNTQTLRKYSLSHFNIVEQFATEEDVRQLIPTRKQVIPWALAKIKHWYLPYYRWKVIQERGFSFDANILKVKGNAYLVGYWQSEKYFADVAAIIRAELTLRDCPNRQSFSLLREIRDTNSVSLHIRRGDYVSNPVSAEMHGFLGLAYYLGAAELIARRVSRPHFFIFSDDISWVKEHLKLPFDVSFVEQNGVDRDYEDLRLMQQCKHHVIANSSFSWWGAWLSVNGQKTVVAPRAWFHSRAMNTRDLLPLAWYRV